MHRVAHEFFTDLLSLTFEPADAKIEIYLLQGTAPKEPGDAFPVPSYAGDGTIYDMITVAPGGTAQFLKLWTQQEVAFWKRSMCHHPAYGIRIFESGTKLRETSICWSCNNFSLRVFPFGIFVYGFDADGEAGQRLFDFCNEQLPFPAPAPREDATDGEKSPAPNTSKPGQRPDRE